MLELIGKDGDLQQQVYLPQNGAENGEAAEERRGDEQVATDADVEGAFV